MPYKPNEREYRAAEPFTLPDKNNADELVDEYFSKGDRQFMAMSSGKVNSTELVAALINQREDFVAGIKFAQEVVDGSLTLLIMTDDEHIIAARDKMGRLPILIGKNDDGYCVSFESFAYKKLGYDLEERELGPGEIVEITADGITQLVPPGDEMHICAFLWSYYGYPTSTYEGVNVEAMRYRNGAIMAASDTEAGNNQDIDYIGGVPDSGTPHAIGYANESGIPFARPFIKYTPTWPRSFMPANQQVRNQVAKMKQIPVPELIQGKKLLFVDDSIVRGTQLQETIDFLYESGAKEVHMRSACPPIMFACKYLNFSRSTSEMELIARQIIDEAEGADGIRFIDEYSDTNTERGKKLRDEICRRLKLTSLEFQSLDGTVRAIGKPQCELCTYCWDGKE